MRINPGKFARFAVLVLILTAALSIFVSYEVLKLTGRKIVTEDELKAKDDVIAKHAKIYELQEDIEKNFLFDYDESEQTEAMAKALAESLGDKYTEYMTASELVEWEEAVNSGFTGIGITFNVTDGRAEVTSVAEDGPADAADIKEGDVIRTVDEQEFETESEFIKLISGDPGKTLKLDMLRGWYTFTANVTIAEVEMRAVSSKVLDDDTGYIRITSFSKNSSKEFAEELKSLNDKKVKSLIIDLRNNGGGYVDQGISICDQILPECTISIMEDKKGKTTTYNSDEEACGLPLAVLVNDKSASAAEIVAAAVKDNKAGPVVGTRTYGKGISQQEFRFKDGSCLMLTTARFLTPSGKVIDGKGVKPDTVVKEKTEDEDEGDRQLKKAMQLVKQG